ncbi:MAG: CoA transferase, partial [Chloroflexi bacterium]|nr:CoA transferase [Chloroflexota bacterium]
DDAGAFGGALLAELGAHVVKVEPGGAPSHGFGPFLESASGERSSLFWLYYHAGKRLVTVDPTDVDVLDSLLRDADVLLDDGSAGILTAQGRTPADVAAAHPRLSVVAITPFGSTGPRAGWRATDLTAWAAGGAMWLNGLPDEAPLWSPGQARHMTGLWAAIGVLAAIRARRRDGRGQVIDLAQQEAVAAQTNSGWLFTVCDGRLVKRMGAETPLLCPNPAVRCRDGFVQISIVIRRQWRGLAAWLAEDGAAEGFDDPKYDDSTARITERERLNDVLARWAAVWSKHDLVAEAERRDLPFAVIQTIPEVAADPALAARQFWREITAPGGDGSIRVPRPPYRLLQTEDGGRRTDGATTETIGREAEGKRQSGREDPLPSSILGPPPSVDQLSSSPLAGVRVLDLSWVLAGPFCTRILADLGAEVIKVEPPVSGDGARWNPPFHGRRRDPSRGGLFVDLNHNKRAIAVNLKDSRGLEIVRRLATEWADVLLENFTAGTLERIGLDPAELTAANPRLSVIRLSAYGQTGPYRDRIGYAPLMQAMSGLSAVMVYPPDRLAGLGLPLSDYNGGLHGALLALAALLGRDETGRGAIFDLSQFEAAVRLLGPALLEGQAPTANQQVGGNRDLARDWAPHGVYPAAGVDRWLALAVPSDEVWSALREALGNPDWAAAPELRTAAGRVARADRLDGLLATWTRTQSPEAAVALLQSAGVPAATVNDGEDLIERDPQLSARNYFQTIELPEHGPIPTPRLPLLFSVTPTTIRRPAPRLGEHNEEVLRNILGFSEAEVDQLILDEVI